MLPFFCLAKIRTISFFRQRLNAYNSQVERLGSHLLIIRSIAVICLSRLIRHWLLCLMRLNFPLFKRQEQRGFAGRLKFQSLLFKRSLLMLLLIRIIMSQFPANLLIANIFYLADYAQRAGSWTLEMIEQCRSHGAPEPEFILIRNVEFRTILARDIYTEAFFWTVWI